MPIAFNINAKITSILYICNPHYLFPITTTTCISDSNIWYWITRIWSLEKY